MLFKVRPIGGRLKKQITNVAQSDVNFEHVGPTLLKNLLGAGWVGVTAYLEVSGLLASYLLT